MIVIGSGTIQGRIGKLDFYFNACQTHNSTTHHGYTQIWFDNWFYLAII